MVSQEPKLEQDDFKQHVAMKKSWGDVKASVNAMNFHVPTYTSIHYYMVAMLPTPKAVPVIMTNSPPSKRSLESATARL